MSTTAKAQLVRDLLQREGSTQPFWTTECGVGTQPTIKIVCQDLTLLHALDDFLRAAVKEANL